MKVAVSLAKSILPSLGITAATSAMDAEIKKYTLLWNNTSNNFKQ